MTTTDTKDTNTDTAAAEIVEGYVVDVACIRDYPRHELLDRARTHTKECSMTGHCIESGFGLVGEDDRLTLLDAEATPLVVDAILRSRRDTGIWLRARRSERDGEMVTTSVEEVPAGATSAEGGERVPAASGEEDQRIIAFQVP